MGTSLSVQTAVAAYHKKIKLESLIYAPSGVEPTRNIIVLIDRPEYTRSAVVLGDDAESTFARVAGHAIQKAADHGVNAAFTLTCPKKPDEKSSNLREVLILLDEMRPDAVIVAGYNIARTLFGSAPYKQYGRLNPTTIEWVDPDGSDYGIRDLPIIVTAPIRDWCDPDPPVKSDGNNGGGMVNLIGHVIEHMFAAIRGSNRYDISKYVKSDHVFIDDMKKFKSFYRELCGAEIISLDTETVDLSKVANKVLCLQATIPRRPGSKKYTSYFLPLSHRESSWLPEEHKTIVKKMRVYFESGSSKYHIWHNAKFDLTQLFNYFGVRWYNHAVYDTAAGEYCLSEDNKWLQALMNGRERAYTLSVIERRYGYTREGLAIDKEDRDNMSAKSLTDLAEYGCIDTATPYLIHLSQIQEAERRGYDGFLKVVTDQISAMTQVMARMEFNGIPVDHAYLQSLMMQDSSLNAQIAAAADRFKDSEAAQLVNEKLLKKRGYSDKGLFGKSEKPWLFNLSEKKHKQALYFGALRLKPLEVGKSGEPSLDKGFQKEYSSVPEVQWLSEYNKVFKLKTAFADSFQNKLLTNSDSLATGNIHASYSYLPIITGRSASNDPNLQQVPSRGKLAKIIKRVFAAKAGMVLIKSDFAAHEVRMFGNVSRDPAVIELFKMANEAIRRLRLASKEELEEAWEVVKREGDIHIQNVKRFFGLDINKDHPLRQAIKIVVFGVMYGKGARTLALDILNGKLDDLRDARKKVTDSDAQWRSNEELAAKVRDVDKQIAKLTSDGPDVNQAKDLIKKLFNEWSVGNDWMSDIYKQVGETYVLHGPTGRVRHLFAAMHSNESVVAAMRRRGPNSIIQGLASDIGFMAGQLAAKENWETFVSQGLPSIMSQVNAVHDSTTNTAQFILAPVGLYLVEHSMTTLAMDHYREVYDFDMEVPLGFDIEIGLNEADMIAWKSLRFDDMKESLKKLAEQAKMGKAETRAALANLDAMASVREKELVKNPYRMRLKNNTDWYRDNIVFEV